MADDRKVREIMTANPRTVGSGASVTEAAQLMVDGRIGALPVVDDGKLVGIVTEGDLIHQDVKLEFPTYIQLLDGFIMYPPSVTRFDNEFRKAVAAKVQDVMTREAITIDADATVADAATLLVERDISRLPVLSEGKLVGVISKSDLVRSLLSE